MYDFHSTAALADHHRAELHTHAQRSRLARSARRQAGVSAETRSPSRFSRLAQSLLSLW